MSVWIPYLRSSPAGGRPGWGRGPRPRSPSRRVPARGLVVGVRVTRACHRWARRSPRCSEAGEGRCGRSLRPRRTPRRDIGISFARRSSRFSLDHGFVRSRSRSPRDRASSTSASRPTPVRLRPEAERCATGEISPASVSVSAARWPTRRTACSFSPAVSLGDDGPFARPLPVPLSRLCCHGSSLHPRRGPPGEPGGVNRRLTEHVDRIASTLSTLRVAATRRHLGRIGDMILDTPRSSVSVRHSVRHLLRPCRRSFS